jgi:conjugative transfer signal peptidase TraF
MSRLYTQHYFPNLERAPGAGVFRQVTLAMVIGSAAAFAVGLACHATGVRVNTTRSIPLGIYLTSSSAIEKGAYVMFCPPPSAVFEEARQRGYIGSGLCPGGYGYMMKKVLAAKADAIDVADDGVRVNGELLPLSAPLKADKAGRPLPRYQVNSFELGNSEVLLMSDVSSTSFDSRYFGPIHMAHIKSVIEPVFVWQ